MADGEVRVADNLPKTDATLEDNIEHLMKFIDMPTNERMFVRAITGAKTPVDEKYFKPEELAAMRQLVSSTKRDIDAYNKDVDAHNAMKAGRIQKNAQATLNKSTGQLEWTDVKIPQWKRKSYSVRYEDYPDAALDKATHKQEDNSNLGKAQRAWTGTKYINPSIAEAKSDPTLMAMTTLGQFNYETDKDGNVIVVDKYDFNARGATRADLAVTDAAEPGAILSPYVLARRLGGMMVPDDGSHGYDVRINLGNPKDWEQDKKAPAPILPANMLAPVAPK